MSDMIERVAKAINPQAFRPRGDGDRWYEVQRDRARDRAIEAIKAMREPTPAMLNAGWRGMGDEFFSLSREYKNMIDAALDPL